MSDFVRTYDFNWAQKRSSKLAALLRFERSYAILWMLKCIGRASRIPPSVRPSSGSRQRSESLCAAILIV